MVRHMVSVDDAFKFPAEVVAANIAAGDGAAVAAETAARTAADSVLTAAVSTESTARVAADAAEAAARISADSVLTAAVAQVSQPVFDVTQFPAPALPLIAVVGDSIANNSGILDTAVRTNAQIMSARGWAYQASARIGGRCGLSLPGVGDPGSSGFTTPEYAGGASGGAFAVGGARTTTLLTYGFVDAAARSAASVVVVHIGTNDVSFNTPAAGIAANILTIWRILTAAGKTVIATTIMPRDIIGINAAKAVTLNDTNILIRTMAALEPRVVLCDWYSAMLDSAGLPPNNAGGATQYTMDGLHPNVNGAGRMAAVLAPVIDAVIPTGIPPDHLPVNPFDANVLTPNVLCLGNTAGVATSWSISNVGTPTSVTKTKVARTDLIPGEWQQVAVVAAAVNTDGFSITVTDSVTSTWAVGDQIYAFAEIQADTAGWDCRELQLDAVMSGSAAVASIGQVSTVERTTPAQTLPVMPALTSTLVYVTPRITVPASLTAIRAVLRFYGSATIRIGRLGVVRIPQPTGLIPAQVLNLLNWKVSIPTPPTNIEVKQPALATYSDPLYFTVPAAAQDRVQFTARAGDAVQVGAQYPRSELREMASAGLANASWTTAADGHRHTMDITQRVTNLPVVQNKVVCGQIHDAAVYVMIVACSGSTLYASWETNGAPQNLDTAYVLGTVFTLRIDVVGGFIDVYYNGVLKVHQADAGRTGCYFKAGCYTQTNTTYDAAGAYGQVEILSLSVTHT